MHLLMPAKSLPSSQRQVSLSESRSLPTVLKTPSTTIWQPEAVTTFEFFEVFDCILLLHLKLYRCGSLESALQPLRYVTGGCLGIALAHRKFTLPTRLHHWLLPPNRGPLYWLDIFAPLYSFGETVHGRANETNPASYFLQIQV